MRASDPNARAQGRLQGVVKVKDGPTKNRCNYDYSGLRLLAVAKYEGLPPLGAIHWVRNFGGAEIMSYIRRRSHAELNLKLPGGAVRNF
jgi:hypothetical protein